MRLSDFDYPLEEGKIAQVPAPRRDHSRLMVVNRATGRLVHRHFYQVTDFLKAGDLLVLNDTRVVRARLRGNKESGGAIEVFLLRDLGENRWESLIRGKVAAGTGVVLEAGGKGVVEETQSDGKRVIRFLMKEDLFDFMERYGQIPLPPYVHRNGDPQNSDLDRDRYQTIYARNPGAVAAPTAGLHFSEEVLSALRSKGIEIAFTTLHVGYGTFKPVTVEDIQEHEMDEEFYAMSQETARAVNDAMQENRRIIAVGTTSTRALESASDEYGRVHATSGNTNLFIYPGYRFRVIKGLITNFHLPKSTLLMLVAALMGKEHMDHAYQEARTLNYRFYSYGDAMLIL